MLPVLQQQAASGLEPELRERGIYTV